MTFHDWFALVLGLVTGIALAGWIAERRRMRRVRETLNIEVRYWIGERDRWRNLAEHETTRLLRELRDLEAQRDERDRLRLN